MKEFEGFRSKAYQDVVGVWTIGYGCAQNVRPGDRTTEADADRWLRARVNTVALRITDALGQPLTQGQLDALADFGYNLGLGNLRGSTLWKKLQAGDFAGAADEFQHWSLAGGRQLPALLKRRLIERSWFVEAIPVSVKD